MDELKGWRKAVSDQNTVRAAGALRVKNNTSQRLYLAEEQNALLIEAARARNISMAGYSRRAVQGFIAFDLGLSARDLVAMDPRNLTSFGGLRLDHPDWNGKDANFEVYGSWEIDGLRP